MTPAIFIGLIIISTIIDFAGVIALDGDFWDFVKSTFFGALLTAIAASFSAFAAWAIQYSDTDQFILGGTGVAVFLILCFRLLGLLHLLWEN